MLQEALKSPGNVTQDKYNQGLFDFWKIAGIYIFVGVFTGFLVSHYHFRWRQALNDQFVKHWPQIRAVEGASQRVQEDTKRFAAIMETLGADMLRSLITLAAFLPLLARLSKDVKTLPVVGETENGLVIIAALWALGGTMLLSLVGIRLPGLEFNNQRAEAAYRKELVYGEDDGDRDTGPTAQRLFGTVRESYFTLYLNFLYFNVAKWSYLQCGGIVPYLVLGPTVVGAKISLGEMMQITGAFGQVEGSFQFLIKMWPTIVELICIYKRLHTFSQEISSKEIGLEDTEAGTALTASYARKA